MEIYFLCFWQKLNFDIEERKEKKAIYQIDIVVAATHITLLKRQKTQKKRNATLIALRYVDYSKDTMNKENY